MGNDYSVPMSKSLEEKLDTNAEVESVFEEEDFLLQFNNNHEKVKK